MKEIKDYYILREENNEKITEMKLICSNEGLFDNENLIVWFLWTQNEKKYLRGFF